jgi:hypothetical protein
MKFPPCDHDRPSTFSAPQGHPPFGKPGAA